MPAYLSKLLGKRVQKLLHKNTDKAAQGTYEWHHFRHDHLNASEAYAVLSNEKLGKTGSALAHEKCKPFEAPLPTEDPYFIRGHEQEPKIRDIYSQMTGSKVHSEFGSFQHYKYSFLAASVDGITDKGVVVEIKSRSKVFHSIPFKDWVQVQLQLEVMNLQEADYVQAQIADGDRLIEYKCMPVKRDHGWFKRHALPLFQKFWGFVTKHRKAGTVPDPEQEWVVASDIRNYSLGDPLIDYLERYYRKRKRIDRKPEYDFGNFFCRRGIEFEARVVEQLMEQFGDEMVTIWRHGQPTNDSIFTATRDALAQKVPILYHAPIRNEAAKTWGIPDLLVRGDYLNKIVQHPLEFINPDIYYVVDIKLGVLDLTANGVNLCNNTKTRAYKGQLAFYNEILKTFPGQDKVTRAFIIGKKWHYTKQKVTFTGNHWYERYGVIDFSTFDEPVISTVSKGIEWVRCMRKEGKEWTLDPPSRCELMPNMKNDEDQSWRELKEQLAVKNGEITLLWQCGIKNREIARGAGLESIYDPGLSAERIGINGPYKSRVLNNIIEANQQSDPLFIRDVEILQPPDAPWLNNNCDRIFIDYETISDLVEPGIDGDLVFMIGAWYRGKYKSWVVDSIKRSQELEIARKFFIWLGGIQRRRPVALYYWSKFEATQTEKLLERHQLFDEQIIWRGCDRYDLCQEIQEAGIAARGAFNYKLKKFTNALYKNKAIKTHWGTNECSDGLKAMVMTYYLNQRGGSLKRKKEMKDIIAYNKIDCKSMFAILGYIKKVVNNS